MATTVINGKQNTVLLGILVAVLGISGTGITYFLSDIKSSNGKQWDAIRRNSVEVVKIEHLESDLKDIKLDVRELLRRIPQ